VSAVLGQAGVSLGLVGALLGVATLALGLRRHDLRLLQAGRRYAWVVATGAVVSTAAMELALLRHDFSLRYVAEQNGYGEEPEWGAISDPEGYRALKSIDSYQAVKDGVAYPAVLLTTGVTDPRVAPFHLAKMTARLQAANQSGKPILLRVDYDAGHGIGSTRAQQDREAADTYAFLLWQTGVPGYQPAQ